MKYPITWVSISNYWDGAIDGTVRFGPANKFHYFSWDGEDEDIDTPRQYFIYRIHRSIMTKLLRRTHDFRNMVSWSWDYDPRLTHKWDKNRDIKRKEEKSSKAYYKKYKTQGRLHIPVTERIGLILDNFEIAEIFDPEK